MADDGSRAAAKRFGNYEVLDFVREDGGARIYRARQLAVDRIVTLVILPREAAEKPALRTRFERRLAAASKMRHPNIISAIDAGSIAGHQFLAVEHVVGRVLSDLFDEGEWFGVRRALRTTLDVVRAIEHMHSVGILHRDVTPRVVILCDTGGTKIRGFSSARPHRSATSETWFDSDDYSTLYKAPDWVTHKTLDVRADLYSVGCVLFQTLTGKPPYPARTAAAILQRHVNDPLPDPTALRSDLPRDVVHIVAKSLAKDRECRYATPTDFAADIETFLAGGRVEPPKTGSPKRSFLRRRRGSA